MRQPGDRDPAPGSLALVQDFVNTADLEGGSDFLRDTDEVVSFWVSHGGSKSDLSALTAEDVAVCRDLRNALRAACRAHAGVEVPLPSTLDETFRQGPLVLRVNTSGDASLQPAPNLTRSSLVVATIAAAVFSAVAAGTWSRLKACAADPCQWVYYDRSPAGRSRWCTMAICGSRAKMRTYRARTS
ncbi:CGNR zinc finger domain-containing protein [Micromonospora sp. NPDC005305]|uniref:CGNR zinc finger domain-containing protein n=1 Tax=Micromonospora sp. NPDC005305 TaxID=3156875 RepID=UPI0033B3D7B1